MYVFIQYDFVISVIAIDYEAPISVHSLEIEIWPKTLMCFMQKHITLFITICVICYNR